MTKTNRQIVEFLTAAKARLEAKDAKDKDGNDRTKFIYALRKVYKQCQALYEQYLEEREDIDVDLAAVNEDGILLRETETVSLACPHCSKAVEVPRQGGLKFTKDGMKERSKRLRAAYAKEVKVTPFGAPYPDDISDEERDVFEGFVPDGPALAEAGKKVSA